MLVLTKRRKAYVTKIGSLATVLSLTAVRTMKIESSFVSVKTVAIKPNKNMIMAPKSKLILIMVALSLRKKKICALALLVMLDKVENEDTGRRSWVRKIFQEKKNTVFNTY